MEKKTEINQCFSAGGAEEKVQRWQPIVLSLTVGVGQLVFLVHSL